MLELNVVYNGSVPFKSFCIEFLMNNKDQVDVLIKHNPEYTKIINYYNQQLNAFYIEVDEFISYSRSLYYSYLNQPKYDVITAKAETVAQIKDHKYFGYALGTMTNHLHAKDLQFSVKMLVKRIPDYAPYDHTIYNGYVDHRVPIGWCGYRLHSGALLTKHLEKHKCIEKECSYLQKNPDHPYWHQPIKDDEVTQIRKKLNQKLKKAYEQDLISLSEYNTCKHQVDHTKLTQLHSLSRALQNFMDSRRKNLN